ncbi:acetyltransferase [Terracidiphilus gabretensis]|jgi:predicted GNAT superfamily acetyltransferase|uniref:acetyltransferase n=1 Tax=Terracidiphilus gabretensis TaxID=1577687 RepID=UPI00071BDD30|nr:acetyltransferase [Terracidiphilus gabretensis]
MTQQADSILIRSCQGRDEFEACVRLQIEIWGYDPADLIPNRSFMLAQKIGGQVMGAFDTSLPGAPEQGSAASLIGYAYAIPGIKPNSEGPQSYLHSHMLAVSAAYRNRGLGVRLKLSQRQEALSRGLRHMEWTFDPLEIKNAFLNIHKLGAIIRRYYPDFYGVSSSRLQGGLPTDRLVAEWCLDSPHVMAAVEGKAGAQYRVEERIIVPASIYQWKASDKDRERAAAVQLENRGRFQQAFARGLAVTGFDRDAEGNGIYELTQLSQVETRIPSV